MDDVANVIKRNQWEGKTAIILGAGLSLKTPEMEALVQTLCEERERVPVADRDWFLVAGNEIHRWHNTAPDVLVVLSPKTMQDRIPVDYLDNHPTTIMVGSHATADMLSYKNKLERWSETGRFHALAVKYTDQKGEHPWMLFLKQRALPDRPYEYYYTPSVLTTLGVPIAHYLGAQAFALLGIDHYRIRVSCWMSRKFLRHREKNTQRQTKHNKNVEAMHKRKKAAIAQTKNLRMTAEERAANSANVTEADKRREEEDPYRDIDIANEWPEHWMQGHEDCWSKMQSLVRPWPILNFTPNSRLKAVMRVPLHTVTLDTMLEKCRRRAANDRAAAEVAAAKQRERDEAAERERAAARERQKTKTPHKEPLTAQATPWLVAAAEDDGESE